MGRRLEGELCDVLSGTGPWTTGWRGGMPSGVGGAGKDTGGSGLGKVPISSVWGTSDIDLCASSSSSSSKSGVSQI